jgi:hypothetical protein
MLILRLDFKSGLHLEFNYPPEGAAVAQENRQRAAAAMMEREQFTVSDYGGREGDYAGAELCAVSLVDVDRESASILDVNLAVDAAQKTWMQRHGIALKQPVNGAAVRRTDA